MEKKYIFGENCSLEKEFFYAYSPRCQSFTQFDLNKDFITNRTNSDIDAGFDYVSISLKQKQSAPLNLSTECEFDVFGAPLIVIAENVFENDGKIFYGDHIEVVAYEEGINVWFIKPNKKKITAVKLIAQKKFLVKEKEKFTLNVEVKNGEIIAKIGDNVLIVPYKLPKEFYVGITACEGINKFYNFNVESK